MKEGGREEGGEGHGGREEGNMERKGEERRKERKRLQIYWTNECDFHSPFTTSSNVAVSDPAMLEA